MRTNRKFRWLPAAEDVRALLLPWAVFTVCFAIDKAAFTDKVLGGVVERLKRVGGPTWMLYVSDHGESVCARRFRTDTDSCLMEVPMVLWTSSEYRESHRALLEAARSVTGAALRNDLLFPTVLRLCDVDGYEGARFDAAPFGRLNANVQERQ